MADIKLIVMLNDETWFWVWHDLNYMWEAFYERGEEPARRLPSNDTERMEDVLALMRLRVL